MNTDILSDLIIDKVFSVGTIYHTSNSKGKRKPRPRWAIILKYEGETIYNCKGKKIISNSENMVILPKGCVYEWVCTKSGHYAYIEFDANKTIDEIIPFPISNSEKILKILKELSYKRDLKLHMYNMECIKEIYNIILKLVNSQQKKYTPSEKAKKIQPALDYIAKNYHKKITNDQLANTTGLSTVYFRKIFAEVTEMSPITYVHSLRINKAKEMLKSDYSNLSSIAQSVGYANIYDFSRDFKKHVGIPPSKY